MSRFTNVIKTITIVFFVFISFVGKSDAIDIIRLGPANGFYSFVDIYDNYLYYAYHAETDEPYYAVSWYVDGVYVATSPGSAGKTDAYFYPTASDMPGSLVGTEYEIKAVAWSIGTPEVPSVSDTDTRHVWVFCPIHDNSIGTITRTSGWAEIVVFGFYDWVDGFEYDFDANVTWAAAVNNCTDSTKGYEFKFEFEVNHISPDGVVTELYDPDDFIENEEIPASRVFYTSKSDEWLGNDGLLWGDNDFLEARARTEVTVWNLDNEDLKDKWSISAVAYYSIPEDD